ncbi:hypothetical protein FE840_009935 [Peteryoungia desertarenae]|uniref:Uncharacterized protein n=1 Tax=Peteryoungia desertarenae TaxID=1813451 RepID=A0ABX6QMW5_9HYPH|nr:hypothetical protein [Peteryoungia desertarenae]QLF69834.1 hypothetical protein FE840_009935 [Peteryoungia desertarenae]
MVTVLQILVRNLSASPQYFHVFQKQARFPSLHGAAIRSNCLGCRQIGNYNHGGGEIAFLLDPRVHAGALSSLPVPAPLYGSEAVAPPLSRSIPSLSTASRPLMLAANPPKNLLPLSLDPLAFGPPSHIEGLEEGMFAIAVPRFTPMPGPQLLCGVGVMASDGSMLLSSAVTPAPNRILTCHAEPVYYVRLGYQPGGGALTYDISHAAECDFRAGATTFTVTYNSDGTFSSEGM